MDQNYIQRYHTAKTTKQASRSIWLCVAMYVPASLLFFIIGTSLYAFYNVHPEMISAEKLQTADQVLPHFMVTKIPTGLVGLIVSALLSAAMSTISSNMNASATVFTMDIYKKYFRPEINDKQQLFVLHIATVIFGLIGLGTGLAMIGAKSLLDIWWELSGIFAGGMLGLFLLGLISRQTRSAEAAIATIIGVIVILWMTFSDRLNDNYAFLKSPMHKSMIIVVGTLSIFLSGILITKLRAGNAVPVKV